jgi:hypothetical protein
MPVSVDHKGRMTITTHEATRGLQGRSFRRRDPQGDPGDVVTVGGAIDVGNADVGPIAELCISSVNFGELIDGEAVATIDVDTFAAEYTELSDADLAVLRADAVAASIEDTKKAEAAAAKGDIPTWRLYR